MFQALRLILGIVLAALAACGNVSPAQEKAHRPRVVCTTGMIADAARAVGGEHFEIVQLMGEGVDPHLYKPSPLDVRTLTDADLVLYNGLHLEGKMGEILESLGRSKPVVAVTERLDRDKLLTPEGAGGAYDPHAWFDVALWSGVINPIRDAMEKILPHHAEDFRANAEAYQARLLSLDDWVRETLAVLPPERRILVTAHDAFGYFARAYGLEVHAIQGISTESEAALKDINNLVDLLVSRRVPAVFIETSVSPRNIQALVEGCRSRGHHVRVGGSLFSDAMGAPGSPDGTYEGMVRHNVRTIVEGLTSGG
jgi:manganese/zinc/iron transport system substrate-binding protein